MRTKTRSIASLEASLLRSPFRNARFDCNRATTENGIAITSSDPEYAGWCTAEKKQLVFELIGAKEETGKTYTQIANEIGLTNAYTAQLFYNQVHIAPSRVQSGASAAF